MTLGNEEYRELARALLATCPEEIDCEQWLDSVGFLATIPGTSVEQILVNFADPNTEVDGARSEPSSSSM